MIGDVAYLFRQIAHYRYAAGIVGNRTERIERDDDAGHGQHRHHGYGDSVKTTKVKTQQNSDCDKANRQRGGVLTNRESGDNICRMARL